jgi:hypothetical protein
MTLFRLTVTVAILLFATVSRAQSANSINAIVSKALEKENFSDEDGVLKLYGIQTNGADTKNGVWACAKVVTIVLKKAAAVKRISLGVRHVEADLKRWKKIKREEDLKPGDVIVWVSRFKGRDDRRCTGGGNCHVGIVTENGYFHNSPLLNKPTFDGISPWGFSFKMGYRPPK